MVERITNVLVGILPLFLILPIISGLFGGLFGQPQTRSVQKTGLTSVTSAALQKTFSSTRRFYSQVFVRLKNSTTAAVTSTVKVGAFLNSDTDTITDDKTIFASNPTIPAGGVYAFTVVSPIVNPQSPDPFLNKYIKLELGAALDVQVFQYSESEV